MLFSFKARLRYQEIPLSPDAGCEAKCGREWGEFFIVLVNLKGCSWDELEGKGGKVEEQKARSVDEREDGKKDVCGTKDEE